MVLFAPVALLLALGPAPGPAADSGWREDVERFRRERAAEIQEDDGWLSVAGLFWIVEGETTFGSGADVNVPLRPPVPALAGRLIRTGESVRAVLEPGVDAGLGAPGPDGSHAVRTSADGDPTVLRFGEQRFFVIQRGDRLAVRLVDDTAPNRKHFAGLRWYPPDPAWRKRAGFVAYAEPRTLKIADVTGGTREAESPGVAVFEVDGREQRLQALSSGDDELFFIFRDATSGEETYGAGRFLYAPLPVDGVVELDFNRAVSPPCAYTLYATCPLPPRDNWLDVAIEAGEKDPGILH